MASRRLLLEVCAVAILVSLAVPGVLSLGADSARADDDHTGNIGVSITDPDASPSPSPAPLGTSGSGGRGPSGDGTDAPPAQSEPTPTPAPGADAGWIVVSGLSSSAHGELNPLRGWVHTSLSVANHSESTPVSGTVQYRLHTLFGTQIGPTQTRPAQIEGGETVTSSSDLPGVGQWPVVRVTATFTPSGSDDAEPVTITREAWVLSFPWLLLAVGVLVIAAAVVLRLRGGSLLHGRSPW